MIICNAIAGQAHVVPHLSVPGVTAVPQRLHVDQPRRRNLNLAVACCMAGGVYCQEVTGTQYDGYTPAKQYQYPNGKPYASMGAEEYCYFLDSAMEHFKKQLHFRSRKGQALLVHDKSTVHTSKVVQQHLDSRHLEVMVMPPRSPDMQPLDYGIFSTCKTKLAKHLGRTQAWTPRVLELKDLIVNADIAPPIRGIVGRLEACVSSGGGHIESQLAALQHRKGGGMGPSGS